MATIVDRPRLVLFDFLRERLGLSWSTDFRAVGRLIDGVLAGVVGYERITSTSCEMHWAGDHPHWLSRAFLREVFRYPFEFLGLNVVIVSIGEGNQHSLQLVRRLGFEDVAVIPDAHPSGALHILQMRREHCRWVQRAQDHGEIERTRRPRLQPVHQPDDAGRRRGSRAGA